MSHKNRTLIYRRDYAIFIDLYLLITSEIKETKF